MKSTPEEEIQKLRQAIEDSKTLLADAIKDMRQMLADPIMEEVPVEVEAEMASAVNAIQAALRCLKSAISPVKKSASPLAPAEMPTKQQGQFLAFIRAYMMANAAGVAPSHTNIQHFFGLTPPSVNSMLIRLEQRGFISRIPGKARAIELTIDPDLIPPLERPFKLR